MTAALADENALSSFPEGGEEPSRRSTLEVMKEVAAMSRVSLEEEGLLSYVQAAMVLEVTPPRIAGLVRDKMLRRFDFFGRPYVSLKEVCARRTEDLKAGRPKRNLAGRLTMGAKLLAEQDRYQWASETVADVVLDDLKKKQKKTKKKS